MGVYLWEYNKEAIFPGGFQHQKICVEGELLPTSQFLKILPGKTIKVASNDIYKKEKATSCFEFDHLIVHLKNDNILIFQNNENIFLEPSQP